MSSFERLDARMVNEGISPSRQKAKEAIVSGAVFVNGKNIVKPSFSVTESDTIVCNVSEKYVSRGGLKLEPILDQTSILGFVAMDVGASTGGFTQCMLDHGAKLVYAVDVGHGQLHESLKNHPSVINLEGTDIRSESLKLVIGYNSIDFCSVDVSFISLNMVLPSIYQYVKEDGYIACLVKPQFEVGKKYIGKHGVVKDKAAHIECLTHIRETFSMLGLTVCFSNPSPITGGEGNIEYVVLVKKKKPIEEKLGIEDIKKLVDLAFKMHK